MSQPKENRYVVKHLTNGLYLGNGWWSKGPEAVAHNHVPTFNGRELAELEAIKGGQGPTGAFAVLVGHEVIDMLDGRISAASAVEHGLVERSWCPMVNDKEW